MLRRTSRDARERLSFEGPSAESRRKNPGRLAEQAVGRLSKEAIAAGRACPLCGATGHGAIKCPVPIDPAMPKEGPIGALDSIPKRSGPAAPLSEYSGPGRVIVLPRGVHGDELSAVMAGVFARKTGAEAGKIGKKPLRFSARASKMRPAR